MDINQCLRTMMHGGEFWKYHYHQVGRPTQVAMQLIEERGERLIAWRDIHNKHERSFAASIPLADVLEVRKGLTTRTFRENQTQIINPAMCFTLCTRGRTLDLEAVHPQDLRVWEAGIRYLIQQRDASNPRATGRSELRCLLRDLEAHVNIAVQMDPLDAVAEWLLHKRRTTVPRPTPQPQLDVDQLFRADDAVGRVRHEQLVHPPVIHPPAGMHPPAVIHPPAVLHQPVVHFVHPAAPVARSWC